MPTRDNFHSEEVQTIMGKVPSWVVRWGITVVFIIFGGIFLGCYFIKYPDIITSPAQITTHNPPVDLISRYDGLIDTLFVRDGETVESGDMVAILDNTAEWADVKFISERLKFVSAVNYSKMIQEPWIGKNYNLGEIQSAFSAFQKSAKDYYHYVTTEHISKKKELLREQIVKNREYFVKIKGQYKHIEKDLEIQRKSFERDSILYAENVISSADFETSSQNLIQKQNTQSGFNATLSSIELKAMQLEQQLVELNIQQENETSEHERLLSQSSQQLIAEIARWRRVYTLTSPTSGRITFVSYWIENQHVKVGDKLASIVPQSDTQVIGRVQIPSAGFGKVKIGQKANIKLNGYPYMEFGVLKGEIQSLSAVPEQIQTTNGNTIVYIAEVSFSEGLKTSYGKELPMIQQMDGTADVITEDMRLISRFFNPIISLFKNR
ncbi:putative hemolysin secretion protein [Mucinivorans hirudinis]|uniref:Putative hemolysin secretion protein n=1 Tax=Mucinivorans hirudinis TaxID=1433126 RepID=A0A060RAT9_9BACT|nr:putative hemolysin secretion protein [Mucinivorans hirudinis]